MIGNTSLGADALFHNTTTVFGIELIGFYSESSSTHVRGNLDSGDQKLRAIVIFDGDCVLVNDMVHYEIMAKWCNGQIEPGDWCIATGAPRSVPF